MYKNEQLELESFGNGRSDKTGKATTFVLKQF